MKQKLFLMLTAVMLSLMSFTAQATNVITMTTSNAVGSSLKLYIQATGAVTIDGATGTYESGTWVTYTTTAQTITITGDVTYLDCSDNNLTTLDVSKNTALTELYCSYNNLTTLDVSQNTALYNLTCYGTGLSSLDVSHNTALTELYCGGNHFTALDVSHNLALQFFACSYDGLTSLDVSHNTALIKLYCHGNQLTTLDVSKNTALAELDCYSNNIKGADMDKLIASLVDRTGAKEAGRFVVVSENDQSWNICTPEQVATAKAKNWESYRRKSNSGLAEYAGYTPSTNVITMTTSKAVGSSLQLNIKATGAVTIDGATGAYESDEAVTYTTTAQTITITGDVTELACNRSQLTALDVSKSTLLTALDCEENHLAALDVSKNTALDLLYCEGNQFTTLDVSKNTALIKLSCDNNQLTKLDVSKNTVLTFLGCGGNQLTALDVSKNTALTELKCDNNQLTTLDVSKNTSLWILYCFGNQFRGAVMDALIASLVDRTGSKVVGQFVAVSDMETDANRNTCTTGQVAAAKAKNWTSYNCDTNWKLAEYAGSTPSTNVITMTTSKAVGSSLQLNIKATGAVTIDGATGAYESDEAVTYTTTAQTITITGDVTELACNRSQLTALDVSKSTLLTALDCEENHLAALDVSKNTALDLLYCEGNQFTTLDVSKNTALIKLSCDNNQLTKLDVSKNTVLTFLGCGGNQLTALDVSKNTALTELKCDNNQLTTLDVSKNTSLWILYCFGNQFRGAVMDALIASLVDRTGSKVVGQFVAVSDMETDANRNTCTTGQVAAAKAKNWTSYNCDTNWKLAEYAGSEPNAIEGVQTGDDATPTAIYDVSGRRIGQMQHGINIVKMRNGRTRKVMK